MQLCTFLSKEWAHAWHFDESPFSTTIMLQTAEDGGHFEHTLPIRAGRGGGGRNNKKVSHYYYVTAVVIFCLSVYTTLRLYIAASDQ